MSAPSALPMSLSKIPPLSNTPPGGSLTSSSKVLVCRVMSTKKEPRPFPWLLPRMMVRVFTLSWMTSELTGSYRPCTSRLNTAFLYFLTCSQGWGSISGPVVAPHTPTFQSHSISNIPGDPRLRFQALGFAQDQWQQTSPRYKCFHEYIPKSPTQPWKEERGRATFSIQHGPHCKAGLGHCRDGGQLGHSRGLTRARYLCSGHGRTWREHLTEQAQGARSSSPRNIRSSCVSVLPATICLSCQSQGSQSQDHPCWAIPLYNPFPGNKLGFVPGLLDAVKLAGCHPAPTCFAFR